MSEQHDDGGPAMPWQYIDHLESLGEVVREQGNGMTLLDYYAGQIAMGHEGGEDNRTWDKSRYPDLEEWRRTLMRDDARYCYDKAAAMIAEKRRLEAGGT